MSTKKKTSKRQHNIPASFDNVLTEALKHYQDAQWLGKNSPLAAPYLLGNRLQNTQNMGDDALYRGKILQRLLHATTNMLAQQGEQGQADSRLLTLTYFRKGHTAVTVAEEFSVSRAGYYRHRKQAVERLEAALIRQLNPALRLEMPANIQTLVGRMQVRDACLESLQQGKSVTLLGPSGIGKTALGAKLAASFETKSVFWFTFHPGLNDRLSNLLFSLGYFLQQRGATGL